MNSVNNALISAKLEKVKKQQHNLSKSTGLFLIKSTNLEVIIK